MARKVAIVSHTHWDREWYEPFQRSRLRLVELLDELLTRLDSEPGSPPFLLDGQVALVDDYLEVCPEAEPRIKALAGGGLLSMGPWYVLPDEFLVSAETLVRNLEFGLERAAAFGGAMEVGYLPDMFGHVAQMPQILRQAGFDHAVVWRGVPAAVNRTGFWWSAPDGSTVRAEYLPVGYANGAAVPGDAEAFVSRIRAHERELSGFLEPASPLLWMYGGDRHAPAAWVAGVVAQANEMQQDYQVELTTLDAYLTRLPAAALPAWTGELRSGARANLLMGVASNRVDVKQAAAASERALERLAEPLCALFLPPQSWPGPLLRAAWLDAVRNAAHDSVCACSVDEVVGTVLHRYAEARQIAVGLADQALAALGRSMSVPGPVIVNSVARSRSGVVELVVGGDASVAGAQVLEARPAVVAHHDLTGAEVGTLLGQVRNWEMARGCDVVAVDVADFEDRAEVTLTTGPNSTAQPGGPRSPGDEGDPVAQGLADLYARAGAHRNHPVRVRVEYGPYQRIAVRPPPVAGFGWQAWTKGSAVDPSVPPAHGGPASLGNGLLTVVVDPADGTFSIGRLSGLGRLVDDGDAGDTYNYSPPQVDAVVETPVDVTVALEEEGPVRAALVVTRVFEWPGCLVGGARAGRREVETSTRLEVHAGERFVRVHVSLDNPCRDHRLRAWFPLPAEAASSLAECAFAVVERRRDAEGGPNEHPLPTFPSRRFVSAGGLTVAHEGLLEYELIHGGNVLALTLMRCVGALSGTDLAYRPAPAGPPIRVEGAQMIGPRQFRYAVATDGVDPYAMVDDAFVPLVVTSGSGAGSRPPAGSALTVTGAEVSAVRRVDDALEIRVFNPGRTEAVADLGGLSGWRVDLRGRALEPFDGRLALRPWEVATVRVAPGQEHPPEPAEGR